MIEQFSHPAIGNLLILIAAIVGVVGSFGLYLFKIRRKRRTIRLALLNELGAITIFEDWDGDVDNIPNRNVVVTTAYDGNVGDIGLLSDEEVEALTQFYTKARLLQGLQDIHNKIVRDRIANTFEDASLEERKSLIAQTIEDSGGDRLRAMNLLRKNLGWEHVDPDLFKLPEEGDEISGNHPLVKNAEENLKIEKVSDDPEKYIANEDLSSEYDKSPMDWYHQRQL